MTNTTKSASTSALVTSVTRHLARIAVAAGVLASSLAVGATASAQSPDKNIPPITTDATIDGPTIKNLPTIPRFDPPPLPCWSWWCDVPLRLPDYDVTSDYVPGARGYFEGQKAIPYYIKIRNIGNADPGAVWSTLASPDGEILAVQPVSSWRTDIVAEPLSSTARWSAPHAIGYLDDGWVVHDTNGIPTGYGYSDQVYLRVWMAGWDRPELIVSANDHAGVDFLGAVVPSYRPHAEVTRDNNRDSFWY